MDLIDLFRLLPRSALQELAYSLVPGSILLFGASWIRWDLVTRFLAFPSIDPVSKAVLVLVGVLSSGFLLLAVVGGFLSVLFMIVGGSIAAILKSKITTKPSYGTSLIWRRLVHSLLGQHIATIPEPGPTGEDHSARMQEIVEKYISGKAAPDIDQKKFSAELLGAVIGNTAEFAASLARKAENNTEWEAVYRILNEHFEAPLRQQLYQVTTLLTAGPLLWTLYHFWLTPFLPLWIAAFLVTSWGAFLAIGYGFTFSVTDRAIGLDEKQAARLVGVLLATLPAAVKPARQH